MAIKFTPLNTGGGSGGSGSAKLLVGSGGIIEKIVFNTSLSPEEVSNAIKSANIPYLTNPGFYPIFVNMDNGLMLAILNYGALLGDPTVEYYVITAISDDTGDEMTPIWIDPILNEMLGASGWVEDIFATLGSNEVPIGLPNDSECALEEGMDPIPVGEYNDVLSNIINCVENTEVTEKELSGTFNATSFKVTENCNIDLLPFIENNKEIVTRINVNVRPILQPKNIAPTTNKQTVKCDEGYDGLSQVTVEAVTKDIDKNIIPENIVAGRSILNVYGTNYGLIENDYYCRVDDIPAYAYYEINKFKSMWLWKVKTIGEYAFYGDYHLKSIEFSDAIQSIDNCAFLSEVHDDDYNNKPDDYYTPITLDRLYTPSLDKWLNVQFGEYAGLTARKIYINSTNYLKELTIPEGTVELQPWVFGGCLASCEKVYLPESLTKIGRGAFYKGVNTDIYDENVNFDTMGVYVNSLEQWLSINFAFEDSNPASAYRGRLFINNEPLPENLVFDESVTEINNYAFYNFDESDLKTVSGVNVKTIGSGAFKECDLTNIDFPNVEVIGKHAFCGALKYNWNSGYVNLKFPKIRSIEPGAFYDCDAIRTLDLDLSSSYYLATDEDTFRGCDNLDTLVLRAPRVLQLYGYVGDADHYFSGTPFEHGSGTMYVPDDLVDAYRAESYYKNGLPNPTSQIQPLSKYTEE